MTDAEIIKAILSRPALRRKVAEAIGRLYGGKTTLDAKGRRERALKAVRAREAKRLKPAL